MLVTICGSSQAAGFAVRPISIETTDGAGALSVANPGATRLYVEASIFRWAHNAQGLDVLESVSDAIVSPPAVWIEAQTEYRFRFKVPKATSGEERTYRVLLTQVPLRDELASGRVIAAVTQSIPVFVEPASLRPPSLEGVLQGPQQILVRNTGGRRVRIVGLTQDGHVLAAGLVGYALAGSSLLVNLTVPVHAGRLDLATDLGPRSIDLKN